jgi:hypothetical protein
VLQRDVDPVDPSLVGGFRCTFERAVRLEVRKDDDEKATDDDTDMLLAAVNVRICVEGPHASPRTVKVELSSHDDALFHYAHVADAATFKRMRKQQQLTLRFSEYASTLAKQLNACIDDACSPTAALLPILYVVDTATGGSSRLDIVRNCDFRFVLLLSVLFEQSTTATVHAHLAFRSHVQRRHIQRLQQHVGDVTALVRSQSRLMPASIAAAGSRDNAGDSELHSHLQATAAYYAAETPALERIALK